MQNFSPISVLTNLMSNIWQKLIMAEKVSDEIFPHIPPHLFGNRSRVFSPAPPRVVLTDRLFVRRRRQRGAKSLRTTCWPICSAVKLFNPLKKSGGDICDLQIRRLFQAPSKGFRRREENKEGHKMSSFIVQIYYCTIPNEPN